MPCPCSLAYDPFKRPISFLAGQVMPDPRKVLHTILRAAELGRTTAGRAGLFVNLGAEVEDVMVVGDLHGHVHNFIGAMKMAALDRNPARHLVVQELVHDTRADPDGERPDLSHRLIDLACALKCQYPDRVHYLPGNHELSELTGRSIAKNRVPLNDLFRQGLQTSYGEHAGEIREAYNRLFESLPLSIRTPNRVLLCHTVPDEKDLDALDISLLQSEGFTPEAMKRGGMIYSLLWGRDTSIETADRFARIMDADLFVIGHHPCEAGFRRANDRTLIVDATDPNASCVIFPAQGPVTMDELVARVGLIQA